MTKKKSIMRAIVWSIVSILLCIAMFVGTTFAWFTDSVSSVDNIIKTGRLDIALEKWDAEESAWIDATAEPIFNYERWEPGYTEVVNLRLLNLGDLAIKWQAIIDTDKELSILSDVINVYVRVDDQNDTVKDYICGITDRNQLKLLAEQGQFEAFTLREFVDSIAVMTEGTLLPEQISYFGIVLQMDPFADNRYQGLDLCGEFTLKILATQKAYESDSFGNSYDENAAMPGKIKIYDLDDLLYAMRAGGEAIVLNDIDGAYSELGSGKNLSLDLNGMTLTGTADNYVIVNRGSLALEGNGSVISYLHGSIENWGALNVSGLNLNVQGSKYGFHCRDGEVVLNDITLKAQRGGLNVQGGKVTVNSGSVTTTSYSTNIGYLVYAASNSTSEVIINGGDFRYEPGYYRHGVLYAGQNATIIVNGGTFGKGGSNTKTKWITEASNGQVIIRGGSFEFDPNEWLDEGYVAVRTDGWWTVSAISE